MVVWYPFCSKFTSKILDHFHSCTATCSSGLKRPPNLGHVYHFFPRWGSRSVKFGIQLWCLLASSKGDRWCTCWCDQAASSWKVLLNQPRAKIMSIHPGRVTWNLQMGKNETFQTSMIIFHVNLQSCMPNMGGILSKDSGAFWLSRGGLLQWREQIFDNNLSCSEF